MLQATQLLLVVMVLTGLAALGSTRVSTMVRIVGVQGVLLGILLLVTNSEDISLRLAALAGASILVKGIFMPALLFRSIRITNAEQRVEPFVGFTMSLIAGFFMLGLGFWIADRLPLPADQSSRLIVPVSLTLVFFGLFLLTSRKKAVSQVIGYLIMENGTFIFSLSLATELPAIVEMGVLLDVFAAVFIMGITIFHISREFDHIDTSRMVELQDSPVDTSIPRTKPGGGKTR